MNAYTKYKLSRFWQCIRFPHVILVILLMLSLWFTASKWFGSSRVSTQPPAQEQHLVNTDTPSFSGEVTEIRFQAVPRTFYASDLSADERDMIYEKIKDCTFLQLYYGYKMDGQWYDYPIENYDLKGIFKNAGNSGFDAADGSHVVQIGPYIIICVTQSDCSNSAFLDGQLYDSLGTIPEKPFEEYHCWSTADDPIPQYGYCNEFVDISPLSQKPVMHGQSGFPCRYYFILEENNLPEDYVLTYPWGSLTSTEILTLLPQ